MTSKLRLVLAAAAVLLAACGGDGDPAAGATTTRSAPATGGSGGGSVGGEVVISGSSTVEPVSAKVGEDFATQHPSVAVRIDGPGTGDGFKLFCNGEIDIADASRQIKDEEAGACRDKGLEFVELKVAIDGLSVITSPRNDQVDCLSFPDLYALMGPESTGFTSWSDANELGKRVGGSGDYPDVPLVITAPGEESGTYDSFIELAIAGTAEEQGQPDDQLRPDYQASPNDNVIIEGVAGAETSLGFVGFSFVEENPSQVKSIAVEKEEGDGCVTASAASVADGTYPLARDLYIYVNAAKAASNPALAAYVDYYLSDAGISAVSEVNYVPLTDADLAQTRSRWESRTTGTA